MSGMGDAARQTLVSERDYLAGERDSDVRHEYVDGRLFAMGGASLAHTLLVTNLVTALRNRLRGTGRRVSSSDMKVRLADGRRYYYPDVVVSGNDRREEPDACTTTRPALVVEILSPSSESTDRREKLVEYQSLTSVVDCLILSQDVPVLERFERDGEGWTRAEFGAGETVELAALGLSLPMDELYEDVFPPPA